VKERENKQAAEKPMVDYILLHMGFQEHGPAHGNSLSGPPKR
jgi:hypothetical protein